MPSPSIVHRGPAVGALLGALLGAALSATVWLGERSAIADGANAAGVAFGDRHLLLFLSLPWSLFVMAAGAAAESAGLLVIPVGAFFLAMPVVAGAAWGWIVGRLVRGWRRRGELPAATFQR